MTLSGYFAFSVLSKMARQRSEITRIFLLSSLEEIRLENSVGQYNDVPIASVVISNSETSLATINIQVTDQQYLQLKLKDSSYFDPELLYAITSSKVARIVTSAK